MGHLSRLERNTLLPYQVLCQLRTYESQMSQRMETMFNTDSADTVTMFLFRGHLLLKPRRLPECLLNFSILISKWTFWCLSSAPLAVAQQLMLGKNKKTERERERILSFGDGRCGCHWKLPRGRRSIVKNPSFFLPFSLSLFSFPPPIPTSLSHFSVQPRSPLPPLLDSYLTSPP